MKREIKFRVWNGEQMVSPDYITREGFACWRENSIPKMSDKLMQFTGIRDKNFKEIYEGDVLRVTTSTGYYEIGRVIYKGITARFGFLSPDDSVYGLSTDDLRNEVIGNIYENPELLK